ncbi:bifunctional adenosylcobinamide kinase/adenosylcobinamide-phosphate guanylyltransferase [Streptosporangium sp. NPDC006007]|uniref:bifunctional adenosylcobinamide kinase/adenosylcobinamide-phosphate guanylyltransferase n=1 Tax=Streptosporangium sp. NPDC006007 TaxID=3154575 RepID=UPI0033A8D00D
MKVLISGTAGAGGWPARGCGCASCLRLSPGRRRPAEVVLLSGHDTSPASLDDRSVRLPLANPALQDHETSPGTARLPAGYRVSTGPDGLVLTTPGGHRILYAAPPAGLPALPGDGESADRPSPEHPGRPDGGRAVFDLVLMDVLDRPERLGGLRRRGAVTDRTHVVAVHIDHRVPTEAELARRAALWGVRAVPDGTVLDLGEPAPARAPLPRRTLLLGGARSGKSAEAELRLATEPRVRYVATGPSGDGDAEWDRRVRAHRERRPAHWETSETTDLAGLVRSTDIPLLVDGLGTWVAAVFDECDAWSGGDGLDAVAARCDELVTAWRRPGARVVAVSDEVGLGVVPATSSGRMFRDTLGRLNRRLARESEEVTLVVAGRLLPLPL